MSRYAEIVKHVWTEPKGRAQVEWYRENNPMRQLEEQLGRAALEQFADGGGWRDPEARVTITLCEPPDWDWWEPRHDQPWRRQAARDREFEAKR